MNHFYFHYRPAGDAPAAVIVCKRPELPEGAFALEEVERDGYRLLFPVRQKFSEHQQHECFMALMFNADLMMQKILARV